MSDALLVLNAGSSSIKFAVFTVTDIVSDTVPGASPSECLARGTVAGIGGTRAQFIIEGGKAASEMRQASKPQTVSVADHNAALQTVLDWLKQNIPGLHFIAAGHRVVHGGTLYTEPARIDAAVLKQLKELIPLAPLHQPYALHAIEVLLSKHPQLPQVACFDTAFHVTMPKHEKQFALPHALYEQGVRRYGFHGLSYEYITSVLPDYLGETANTKVVIAHLGHGASMCAIENRHSVATTMSFTPLDGLPMGTRSGSIDPAVVLYLQSRGMTQQEVAELLHHQSGLLGLSDISADMRELLSSDSPISKETVDYFCHRVCRELGALTAALGGLDALVFTGGIGEHAAPIRNNICQACHWLGITIDEYVNDAHATRISVDDSQVSVWVIPTDEEQVIARHTYAVTAS